jgi:peptide/nickel transport system permease protein
VRFLLRRLAVYLVAAFLAITLNFFLPRTMPGNPALVVYNRMSQSGPVSPNIIKVLEVQFGYKTNKSLLDQYFSYWGQLFHGKLGTTVTFYPESVSHAIAQALPWTLIMVGLASIMSFVLGTLLGIIAAWRRGKLSDAGILGVMFLSAVPYFWLGLVVLYLLAVKVKIFPIASGVGQGIKIGFTWSFISSAIGHAILPAFTVMIASLAGWTIGMRNMTITTMTEDYVMVAQAKGLSSRRVITTYAARNAILPNLAGFANQLGFVVAGSLLTEIVFSYPGIGYLLFQAVDNIDYSLMQGLFLIIALCVLVANLLADVAYLILDPRTRQEV